MEKECLQDMERIQRKLDTMRAGGKSCRGMVEDARACMLEDILTELKLKVKMCKKRQEEL